MFRTLAYLIIVTCLACMSKCLLADQTCTMDANTITCDNTIPLKLAPQVHEVFIYIDRHFGEYPITFDAIMFADESWNKVHMLDITAQYKSKNGNFRIVFQNKCFEPLSNLVILRFHGDRIMYINAFIFASNLHLNLLEFSSCPLMKFRDFINSLLQVEIKIENLTLSNVASGSGENIKIDEAFVQVVAKCRVKHLSLRDSYFIVQQISYFPKVPPIVSSVDISKAFVGINGNSIFMIYTYDKLSDGLISLNMSEFPLMRYGPGKKQLEDRSLSCSQLNVTNMKIFLKLENFYANAIATESVVVSNVHLDFSKCLVKLKTIQLRQNRLQFINMTIVLASDNNITNVDISLNEITYISPTIFSFATAMLTLNLESNKLGQMENIPEFSKLIRNITSLTYFNMAKNSVSKLPVDFFASNLNLKVLNLSNNVFETITFNLTAPHDLQIFDLSYNRIHFLDGKSLNFVQSYLTKNKNILEFAGNPLECSCRSVDFIKWVLEDLKPLSKQTFTCELEGEINEVNQYSLNDSKFLCRRTVTIVGLTVFALATLIVITSLGFFCRKRYLIRRQRDAQELFLDEFLNGNLQERYLCQISYASEDEMCVLDTIHPNLKNILTMRTGIERDVICVGDMDFDLGRPIINEILRCISESCVAICVISQGFCKSQWCEMELREAYENKKPIILIFIEEVQEDKMSRLLAAIFNRYTRAKLVNINGQSKLFPDWEKLGDSIIKLAFSKLRDEPDTQKMILKSNCNCLYLHEKMQIVMLKLDGHGNCQMSFVHLRHLPYVL